MKPLRQRVVQDEEPEHHEPSVEELFNINAQCLAHLAQNKQTQRDIDSALSLGADLPTVLSADEQQELAAQTLLLLWELSKPYGLRLRNPANAGKHAHRLFEQRLRHRCSARICPMFHIPPGWQFPLLGTSDQVLHSSGIFYICRTTGSVHVCRPGQSCDAMVLDPLHRDDGYTCDISNMFKQGIVDQTPEQRRDTLVSYARIEKLSIAQRFAESRGQYDADAGDAYFEDEGEEPAESKQAGKGERQAPSGLDDDDEIGSASFDQEEPAVEDDEYVQPVEDEDASAGAELEDGTVANGKRKKPPNNTSSPAASPAKKVKTSFRTTVLLPEEPEARIAYLLRNLDKRAVEADRLVDLLTNYDTHLSIWLWQLDAHSNAAHNMLQRYERRAKHTALTAVERNLRWTSYVLQYLPARPPYFDPLPTAPYVEVVIKAWQCAVRSPYICLSTDAHLMPNFTKVCVAVLYQMHSEGYVHDCSLGAVEFPDADLPEEFRFLREYEVRILVKATRLGSRLVSGQLIDSVRLAVPRAPRVSRKQIAQGWRLLKECFASAVFQYRSELRAALAAQSMPPDAAYTAYLRACDGLRCRATVAAPAAVSI